MKRRSAPRLEKILQNLTDAQLEILKNRVAESTGAIVDIIIIKESSLLKGIESPKQKRIPHSREVVAAYLEKMRNKDKIVHGFAGHLKNKNTYGRPSEYQFYPDCSIESKRADQKSYVTGQCEESENTSMIDPLRQRFQQTRKTGEHHNLVKFRVLLQDLKNDFLFALDIVMEITDDGDFTITLEDIMSPEMIPGEWRKYIPGGKGKAGSGSEHDLPATAPAPPQNEERKVNYYNAT